MPPRIVPILDRLRQDVSGCLTKKAALGFLGNIYHLQLEEGAGNE
jgi:hypothetical protein